MKAFKRIVVVVLVYVGIVIAFESMLGIFQPAGGDTLVITTTGGDGTSDDRVLSRIENNAQVYVAANHWPRAWFNRALANPNVQVTFAGEQADYLAVPVSEDEHDRVEAENSHGLMFRIMTGFPPRYFLRLDPR